jgi:hypothetical protein
MVDVLGLVMSCFVSAANVADVKAAPAVLVPALENNPDSERFSLTKVIGARLRFGCRRHTTVSWN